MNYSIDELNLAYRVSNCLKAEGLYTTDQICELDENELRKIPNLGYKGIEKLKEALAEKGLHLGIKGRFTAMQISPHSKNVMNISLRDWFAGLAMQQQVNTPLMVNVADSRKAIAERAYLMADEMLKARGA